MPNEDYNERLADSLVSQHGLPTNYKYLIMEAGNADAMTAKAKQIAGQMAAAKTQDERAYYDGIREKVRREQAAKQPVSQEEILRRLAKQRG